MRAALGDLVDGAHFFDVVDDDLVYEVRYDFPGWPRVVRVRAALMSQFRGYAEHIEIHAADHLVTHKTDDGRVVAIEYELHGTILATGVAYDNRLCSIIRIENRKVAHWRDYMDSLAAWNALTRGQPFKKLTAKATVKATPNWNQRGPIASELSGGSDWSRPPDSRARFLALRRAGIPLDSLGVMSCERARSGVVHAR